MQASGNNNIIIFEKDNTFYIVESNDQTNPSETLSNINKIVKEKLNYSVNHQDDSYAKLEKGRLYELLKQKAKAIEEILPSDPSLLGAQTLGDISQDLSKQLKRQERILWQATMMGNLDLIKSLLKAGINPNAKGLFGNTALHLASRLGHLEIVKTLLDHGANINDPNSEGASPLAMACGFESEKFQPNEKIINLLISKGAHLDQKTKDGSTPLELAVETGRPDIVVALLNAGADVNDNSLRYASGVGILNEAWRELRIKYRNITGLECNYRIKDYRELIRVLNKITQMSFEPKRHTPNATIVKLLLERGSNPNRVSPETEEKTLKDLVSDKEILELLEGFSTKTPQYGHTSRDKEQAPSTSATQPSADIQKQEEQEKMQSLKLQRKKDDGAEQATPLELAVKAGQLENVEALLKSGVAVNDKSLMYACGIGISTEAWKQLKGVYERVTGSKSPYTIENYKILVGLMTRATGET